MSDIIAFLTVVRLCQIVSDFAFPRFPPMKPEFSADNDNLHLE